MYRIGMVMIEDGLYEKEEMSFKNYDSFKSFFFDFCSFSDYCKLYGGSTIEMYHKWVNDEAESIKKAFEDGGSEDTIFIFTPPFDNVAIEIQLINED